MLKKIFIIILYEKYHSPLRIIQKSYARYKKGGFVEFKKGINREYYSLVQTYLNENLPYEKWIKNNEKDILKTETLKFNPLISIITPTYNTNKQYLIEMIESVCSQTYTNWELCIADDASIDQGTIETLKKYEKIYTNIKVVYRKDNGHISEASNSALEIASGEYVIFLDHDDTLAPNALYEMVKKLNENEDLKLIYSDEDKIDENGQRFDPHFKSGWNPSLFYSQNYISHLTFIKKEIIEKIGGLRKGYEGSQDYDLLLRAIKYIKSNEIDRVEKILYHWRSIQGSTAYTSEEKPYTHEAGLKALKDYFRKKEPKIVVKDGLLPNTYKVEYPIPSPEPLVSLLIPTRDGYDLLQKCIESIVEKTTYTNYEIIILDNQTTCKKTLGYFEKIKCDINVTILNYNRTFNYSAINNFGVKHAKGQLIGLINNDVEVINGGWLTEMVSHALREEIGAVGAKLYYNDDTIQHAGVVLGIGGVAGHSHKYYNKNAYGYFSRLQVIQHYSAVTAACLVMRKSLIEEVGGLNEKDLKVAFNDVDLCLKLQEKGYRNLWTPYAELYHYESKSRGTEDTREKKERFRKEVLYMKSTWNDVLVNDLYYNSNLSNKYENFWIREI